MKYLIVVDMQNDFITGSLGTKEAEAILPKVIEKVKAFDGRVIYTKDTHRSDYLCTQEGKNLPVEHCIRDTHGWEIREDIAEMMPAAKIVDKPTFGSVELAAMLKEENEKEELELELIGLCTDICVVSNALLLKASMPEITIRVDSSCCAGVTPESHEAALTTMRMCQIEVQ